MSIKNIIICAGILTLLTGGYYIATNKDIILGAPTLNIFTRSLIPEIDSRYEVGTSTKAYLRGFFDELCLTADSCKTAWPTPGSTDFTFLSNFNAVNLTPTSTMPIWARGGLNASSTSNFAGLTRFWSDTITGGNATTSTLEVTNTGSRSGVFGGSIRSTLGAPGTFFSASNSGLSNYQFFTMDAGFFSVTSFNTNSTFIGAHFTNLTTGCNTALSGSNLASPPTTYQTYACNTIIGTLPDAVAINPVYIDFTLGSSRRLVHTATATSTDAMPFNAGGVNVGNVSSTTWSLINSKLMVGTSTFASTAGLLELFSTATTTATIDSNHASRGGCIKVKDFDGSGYTYIVANNGTLTASTASCQ